MAMPLDEMYSMLSEGSRIRITEDGEMYPNFETWFVSNDVEREAFSNPLTVTFDVGRSRSVRLNSKSRTNSGLHKLQTASAGRTSRMHFTCT